METENIFSIIYSSKETRIDKNEGQVNNWPLLAAIGVLVFTLLIAAFVA